MRRHTHGSMGLAGIVYYAADRFPPAYRGTVFIGNPVTGRINHDRLEAQGSTYRAIEQPDFLTCDDPWFRPVDLQLAPDGSIYIADFYAPIISHYEVALTHPRRDHAHGRIWRVRYVGAGEQAPSHGAPLDLTSQSTERWVARLASPNRTVRVHATHQLVHRVGLPAVDAIERVIRNDSTPEFRSHALWVLARLGALDMARIERFAHDAHRMVRTHLMKALAERSDWAEGERLRVIVALTDDDAFVRRAAAEALGQHPHAGNVEPLIDLWSATSADDTHLIHVARIALRNNVRYLNNLPKLAARYHAASEVMARLADICLGIRTAPSARFLLDYHLGTQPDADRLVEVGRHIGRYLDADALDRLDDFSGVFDTKPEGVRLKVLRALLGAADERGIALSASMTQQGSALGMKALEGSDARLWQDAIEVVKGLKTQAAVPELVRLATSPAPRRRPSRSGPRQEPLPVAAVLALAVIDETVATPVIVQLLNEPTTSGGTRWRLEKAMYHLKQSASHEALIENLRVAPQSVESTMVRGLSGSAGGGRALLAAIESDRLAPRLLLDPRVNVNLRYAGIDDLNARAAPLVLGPPTDDGRRATLVQARRVGFKRAKPVAARGAEIFTRTCSVCHSLRGQGAKIGPALDGIGMRGLDRLLEDIVDPSRNVDASFRATVVSLRDGRIVTGRVLENDGQTLMLIDFQGAEQRFTLADIADIQQMKMSSMPADISETMNENEFYDLLVYLLDQRQSPPPATSGGH